MKAEGFGTPINVSRIYVNNVEKSAAGTNTSTDTLSLSHLLSLV